MAPDRRRWRQEALVRAFDAAGLDGLLVTSRANIRYLTGFSGSAALVAVTRGDVLLVTDFRYDEQARAEAGAVARVEVESTSVWDRFFTELATLGPLGAVGYEAHALTVQDAERFTQAGQAWRWTATRDLVERLRAAKGPGEVAAIREAAELAGAALQDTLTQVRVGMTELEVAGVLEGALRRLGSEGHPFSTIVASGPRTALPHARSSRRAVAKGEWLLLDFGAQVDGYCADITRTLVVGARATERQRALYELVAEAERRGGGGGRARPARRGEGTRAPAAGPGRRPAGRSRCAGVCSGGGRRSGSRRWATGPTRQAARGQGVPTWSSRRRPGGRWLRARPRRRRPPRRSRSWSTSSHPWLGRSIPRPSQGRIRM